MNRLKVLILPLLLTTALNGQTFEKEVYSIPVSGPDGPVEHPFTGGLHNPMHQFVDIDADGDVDLFLFEPSDGRFTFFRNEGTPAVPLFRYEQAPFPLPGIFGWYRLADFNGDSKADLMTSPVNGNSVAVYLNTGTEQSPLFSLLTTALLDSSGQIVYSESYSVPSFVDMDADGDNDFLSLNTGNGTINYYENTGSAASPLYAFRTNRFQDVQICIGCAENPPGEHGNGAVYFGDIDSDSDPDMLYGDMFHTGLYYFNNAGSPSSVSLDSVTAWFPNDDPMISPGLNQATLADIDGDGDRDLFVSVMHSLIRQENFRMYLNTGSPAQFDFTLATPNYIETFDVGLQAAPALVDIDADGDADLFAGNLDGQLAFLRNVGTAAIPSFQLEDSALVASTTSFMYAPAFADIDADGDKDLFLGNFNGKVEFHRNTGTPVVPEFERELWIFDTLTVGTYAAPSFLDQDNDGDLDIFIGRSLGRVSFYRNDGSASSPVFVLAEPSLQGIEVVGNAKPVFIDEDRDGDEDLIIGDSEGSLSLFRNDGPAGNPSFTFVTSTYAGIDTVHECAPALSDIDNDGDVDLVVGCQRGGLEFYRRAGTTSVGSPATVDRGATDILHPSYPNPFNATSTVRFDVRSSGFVSLKVYDLLGREVVTLVHEKLEPGLHTAVWDASGQVSGVYWYRLETPGSVAVRSIVLIR